MKRQKLIKQFKKDKKALNKKQSQKEKNYRFNTI